MPAAIGIRLAIVSRCGGAVPAGRGAELARARAARGSRRRRPGRSTVVAVAGGSSVTSSARSVGWTTRDERVQAVGARRADEQAEVDLAGRERAQHSRSHSARQSAGESDSARASAGWPSASSASRVRSRMPGRAPGASESERASALRRWAKPCWTSVRRLCGGAGPWRLQADEHGVDVRHRVEDVARDLARTTRTSQASWASTDGTP